MERTQQLARPQLRAMRKAKALSQEDAAHLINKDRTSISRYESGAMTPGAATCRALAALYDVTLDELWKAIEGPGAMPSVASGWWSNFETLEQSAITVRTWEPMVIPGLLQAKDYAAALLGDAGLVDRRLDRQEMVLRRADPVDLIAVLDESVLRRPVGGWDVLAGQLDHLVTVSARPTITIQVLPNDAPAKGIAIGCRGAFVILGFPWPGGLVHFEHTGGARNLEGQHEIDAHAASFDLLRGMALPPAESVERIRAAAAEARR